MKKIEKYVIAAIIIAVFAVAICYIVFQDTKPDLTDNSLLKENTASFTETAETFTGNDDFYTYLKTWASDKDLSYKEDDYGNIIITLQANEGTTNDPYTVICADYYYKNASEEAGTITSLQYIAENADIHGPLRIIFMNNTDNKHSGAENISDSYFPEKANIIYLDSGTDTYISSNSANTVSSDITIATEKTARICNTAIEWSITGVVPAAIDTNYNSKENPIEDLGTFLTYLKTKSITYQIADIQCSNTSNMTPDSIQATILINSYSLETVNQYLDGKAQKYNEDNVEDNPEINYSYKVISDETLMSDTAYSDTTANILTNVLYTIKNGTYKTESDDSDTTIEAVNSVEQLREKDGNLTVTVLTNAKNGTVLSKVLEENDTAASMSGASLKTYDKADVFADNGNTLLADLTSVYTTENDMTLNKETDIAFTPCTYLYDKGKSLSVVHLREAEDERFEVTNMLMNYLYDKAINTN